MIPGGKLLGMALVSTQKALSLVQEQVAGQRGTFGAFLVYDSPGRQRHRHTTDTNISLSHLEPSSGSIPALGIGGWVRELLEVGGEATHTHTQRLPSCLPACLSVCSSVKTERRETERERGRQWRRRRGRGRVLLYLLGGCGCAAASPGSASASLPQCTLTGWRTRLPSLSSPGPERNQLFTFTDAERRCKPQRFCTSLQILIEI